MLMNHRYLWSSCFVGEQLHANALSEAATFAYFLVITVFDWLQFTLLATAPRPDVGLPMIVNSWATFIITVAGVSFLYVRNGGPTGRQFLYRYFPLSVTVGWKFVMAMLVAVWLTNVALSGTSEEVRGWTSTLALITLNIAMFWRIGAQLASLARAETTV
jgi:ABC-type antimicrobial peptide transport system permease subunit